MRAVCCLIVIPRSRSRSMESSTWSTAFLGSIAPGRASRPEPDRGAETRRPPDGGPGGDGHARPPPDGTAPGSGRGEGGVHEAFEEVHLRQAVLLRAPDVPPVRPGREAVGGGPAGHEAGGEVAPPGD